MMVSEGKLPAQMEQSAKAVRQERAQQVEEQCGIQCEGKEMDMSKNRQRGSQRGSRARSQRALDATEALWMLL